MPVTEKISAILRILPSKPGVYQHLDAEGKVLYVGKAKNLKHRVSSYFNRQAMEHGKTRLLVSKVADISYFVVESEADALLLENKLIKEHQPRYNINLKDDKTYPSIVIRKEAFPRIFPTRQLVKDGSEYYGPYASVKTMHGVLDLVKKLYPIRTCSLPLNSRNIAAGKFKVCLEYHLGNCLGPCEARQSEAAYEENVRQIRRILRGHYAETLRDLRADMAVKSGLYQFEEAQQIKEKIDLLEAFQARSSIYPGVDNTDVFTIASDRDAAYVNYLKVAQGAVVLGHTVELRRKMDESEKEMLEYAIVALRERFSSQSETVFVPFDVDISLPGIQWIVPRIGEKKKLLELSRQNAVHAMLDAHRQQEHLDPARHTQRMLETIRQDLHLKDLPAHMECFDNSNFQGTNPVSACVVFRNARPAKEEYRIFNVKTVTGPDDFATMHEVITRRYGRLKEEGASLPQLVVIDGGKGQLAAARQALADLGLHGTMGLIGIAKRLEEIYFPGDSLPLYLDKKSETLRVIQHMRNEAHRFGISRHRNRRSREALRSALTEIPGIGEKTAARLLTHFKSVKGVRAASAEALVSVIGAKLAEAVHTYLHREGE